MPGAVRPGPCAVRRTGPHPPHAARGTTASGSFSAVSSAVSDFIEQTRLAARAFAEFGGHLFNPTVRLGVTGLSRAGKTVFITALVHGLLAAAASRCSSRSPAAASPARGSRRSPTTRCRASTMSAMCARSSTSANGRNRPAADQRASRRHRLPVGAAARMRTLTLDIVDYPGEWLLDLPLLGKSYEQWSAETLRPSAPEPRAAAAAAVPRAARGARSAGAGRRERGDRGGAAVHRLSARLPRGAPDAEPRAAGPLPDAGRSRGLAGADLRAARCAGRGRSRRPARSGQ